MRTVVIFSQAPLHVGGIERNVLQLIEKLGPRFNLHVVGPITDTFAAAAEDAGGQATLHRLPRHSKYDATAIVRFARLFRRLGAEVVHTVEPRSRILGHPAARLAGAKTVHTFQIAALSYDDLSPARERLYRRIENFYNRHVSHRLIFVSEHDRTRYRDLIRPETTRVIYNSADLGDFEALHADRAAVREAVRAERGLAEGTLLAVTVGRLAWQKGIDFLIEAAARLAADPPETPLHFALVGDGELRDELETLARERAVTDRLDFLGFKRKDEVYRLLVAADLFVLPSRFECFPFSIVEAMAAGLPCVVTDVGGNAESVAEGENGFVVPPGDVAALAAALRTLADDPARRAAFARSARARVPRFSTDAMARQTAEVYQELL